MQDAKRFLIERDDPVSDLRKWRVTRWTFTEEIDKAPRFSEKEIDLMLDVLRPGEIIWSEQDVLSGKAGQRIAVIRKGDRRNG